MKRRPRRIAVVTGTRAEYGLLSPILRLILSARSLRLQLLVTGKHLLPAFGRTVREIEADGFPIAARIPSGLSSDSEAAVSASMARITAGCARAFARLEPDLLLLLGDRYEVLAAAAAAVPFRLPIAHIHGGESTEGAIDEQIRHSVTKLSHLHFTATAAFRRRVIQMGEDPRRVFAFGAPGLDDVRTAASLGRDELARGLGLPLSRPWGVMTYHPATLSARTASRESAAMIGAMSAVPGVVWACTLPNADPDSLAIVRNLRAAARRDPDRFRVFSSLGRTRYLSLLRHAAVMAGNSSSGLLEAPSFGLPAVNVGDRQDGRLRAANVIDVRRTEAGAIAAALRRALSPAFRGRLRSLQNPYAGRDACRRIVETLKRPPLGKDLLKKRFHDLPR